MINWLLRSALIVGSTLFFSATVYAQSFQPGYIVEASGDTIKGLVKYREGKSIYRNCLFKKDINSDVNEYLPEAIQAYGTTNGSHLESKQLTDKKGNSLTVFAEVLANFRLM